MTHFAVQMPSFGGVKMSFLRAPLHNVFLRSPLVSGPVKVGLRARLPVHGVALILGNDLAGKKVFPSPEVVENPVADSCVSVPAAVSLSSVFPACVVFGNAGRSWSSY